MPRFPKDKIIEQKIEDANRDNLIGILLQSSTVSYEGRKRLAGTIVQMRGHTFTKDNYKYVPGGMEGNCDKCGMVLLVPECPKPKQQQIWGLATELNCPAARRKEDKAQSYADMPRDLYEKFLINAGRIDNNQKIIITGSEDSRNPRK